MRALAGSLLAATCLAACSSSGYSGLTIEQTRACDPSCAFGSHCVYGHCYADSCGAQVPCKTGLTCLAGFCADDSCDPRCAAGQVCLSQVCVAPVPAPCLPDGGCNAPEHCTAGFCVDDTCSPACGDGSACLSGLCVETSGGLSCAPPYVSCASGNGDPYCANLLRDASNCGGCSKQCPAGELCNGAGVCAVSCVSGEDECSGGCCELATDDLDCGACGNACAQGQVCTSGACAASCSPPDIACGAGETSYCANTQLDPANCGACGSACAFGLDCVQGACAVSCGLNLTVCDATCTDLEFDDANCGGCGASCAASTRCVRAQCDACGAAGQLCCAGDGCAFGLTCFGGVCGTAPPPGPDAGTSDGGAPLLVCPSTLGDCAGGLGLWTQLVDVATGLPYVLPLTDYGVFSSEPAAGYKFDDAGEVTVCFSSSPPVFSLTLTGKTFGPTSYNQIDLTTSECIPELPVFTSATLDTLTASLTPAFDPSTGMIFVQVADPTGACSLAGWTFSVAGTSGAVVPDTAYLTGLAFTDPSATVTTGSGTALLYNLPATLGPVQVVGRPGPGVTSPCAPLTAFDEYDGTLQVEGGALSYFTFAIAPPDAGPTAQRLVCPTTFNACDAGVELVTQVVDSLTQEPLALAADFTDLDNGGAVTSTDANGVLTLCAADQPALIVQAPGYTETILQDIALSSSECIPALPLISQSAAVLYEAALPAFQTGSSTIVAQLVDPTGFCGLVGWTVSLQSPARKVYFSADTVPAPAATVTTSAGQVIFYNVDSMGIAQVSATRPPDAGFVACGTFAGPDELTPQVDLVGGDWSSVTLFVADAG